MKKSIIALLAVTLSAQVALAADLDVDAAHSSVSFTVRHMVSKVTGTFNEGSGTLSFDPAALDKSGGSLSVKVASINTNNAKRDEHLRSPDFFDAAKFPTITLTNLKFKADGKAKYKLTGDLTMHGVTKPVTFALEYGGSMKDPWGMQRHGFTGHAQINRKDWGIVWNKALDAGGLMLGEDVAINLEIEATQKK